MEEKQNKCLGMIDGKPCKVMLPKGRHVCDFCQKRINSAPAICANAINAREDQLKKKVIPKE